MAPTREEPFMTLANTAGEYSGELAGATIKMRAADSTTEHRAGAAANRSLARQHRCEIEIVRLAPGHTGSQTSAPRGS